ncbi:MAG: peptidoglycan-binding protein, partial [Calothrix sp. SM1_7_51]|nr:peptidoglycan-binding protein [Calothrix sp. SM1_7_51]
AVRYFQISCRLSADGIINEATWNALSRMKNHASTCSSNIFPGHGYRYI